MAECNDAGVVRCTGFDSTTEINEHLIPDGFDVYHGTLDTTIKSSGNGSLRFPIPPNTYANSSGAFLAPLGGEFGPGDTFYVAFKQRFSPEMLETSYNGNGWKQVIIHRFGASCSSVELTTENTWQAGFPRMYTDCGARNFDVDLGNGDFLLQQGDYNCRYQNQNPNDCSFYRPNEWMTFYYEIELGQWGTNTSNIRAYVAYEGQPLQQFINMQNYALYYDDSPSERYAMIQLTTYNTNKDETLNHPVAFTWYDDLIVSTSPIYETGQAIIRPAAPSSLVAQ